MIDQSNIELIRIRRVSFHRILRNQSANFLAMIRVDENRRAFARDRSRIRFDAIRRGHRLHSCRSRAPGVCAVSAARKLPPPRSESGQNLSQRPGGPTVRV